MNLKKLVVVLSLVLCASVCSADVSPEKRAEIDELLKLSGMEKLVDQMMHQMISGLRAAQSEVPDGFWDRFEGKMNGQELLEMMIPLYDKYYSLEDLQAINHFYSSPAGKRMLSTLPHIMQEGMALGQKWGAKVAQEALEEAAAELKQKQPAAVPDAT